MKETYPSQTNEYYDYFLAKYKIHLNERINEGHIGLPIFHCVNKSGEKRVIKIGSGKEGVSEIQNNLYGYEQINKIGGSLLIPKGILSYDTPWGPTIDMPDVGISFTKKSITASDTKKNFDILSNTIVKVAKQSSIATNSHISIGLQEVSNKLYHWVFQLTNNNLIDEDTLTKVDEIKLKNLSGNISSVMLLDFTPDNVFPQRLGIKFIDPWKQTTYLGSPIPMVSQFITLSENVYHLPGFNARNLNYDNLINELSNILQINSCIVNSQINLGRALQFSLSSYVRINSDRNAAEAYAKMCKEAILKI